MTKAKSKAKIGSPLFILREECEKDLMSVLDKLAQIGYDGVEFLGFFGRKPSEIKQKLDSCGLTATGNHVAFDEFAKNTDKIIDEHKEIGCKYITIGNGNGGDLKQLEKIGEKVKSAGMKLLFHNHAEELKISESGKTILENIFDNTNPDLLYCELDFGWIGIGGANPEYFAQKYRNRCPVAHFKDYINTNNGFLFRPTGYGIINNAGLYAIVSDCDSPPEWYVMDHDLAYERDSYYDLKISLEYFRNLIEVSNK